MSTHLLSLLFSFLLWLPLSMADICSHLSGYTVHGTSCFKLYNDKHSWTDAEASCVADGGHLASIHSSEEQNFVANFSGVHGPWIGLSGTPPNMTWSDGTGVDYVNWYDTNPDEDGFSCTISKAIQGHLWLDIPCSTFRMYMCRIEDQTEAHFRKVPGCVDTDPAVSPSSTHTVRSRMECAWRCQQDSYCRHFIQSEDGGKYSCEIYSSMYHASTLVNQPNENYQKIYPYTSKPTV